MTEELKLRFLIVDDEQSIRRLCITVGQGLGYLCAEAETAEAALESLETSAPDLVVTDLKLPSLSGVELLRKIKELLPRAEVAIMTGHGSVETAVDAMRQGAYDYIEKPFRVERLRQLLLRMAEKVRLVTENQFLRERVNVVTDMDGIVGSSAKIQDVLRMISRLKETRTPVLVTGESGTGKELVARAIHFRGPLAEMPFVAVDCGSLVPTLMESELFGHEKGSFTGAVAQKKGKFEMADGGTIFLDEIGDISSKLQADLLRVLQERCFYRVGGSQEVRVDVRVIAATNRDLQLAVDEGQFRDDLYYRLNVIEIRLPPLRERREDIPLLAAHFVERLAHELGKDVVEISAGGLKLLMDYDWPGNVRELENVVERAIVTAKARALGEDDFAFMRRKMETNGNGRLPANLTLQELEHQAIAATIQRTAGNIKEAALALGIDRSTLYEKIRKYQIPR